MEGLPQTRQPGIWLRTALNRRNSAHHPDRHIIENAVLPRPKSEFEVYMRNTCGGFILLGVVALASLAGGQDSPSLGDIARQAKEQKQKKEAQSKAGQDSKPPKVITNEEMPSRPESSYVHPTGRPQGAGVVPAANVEMNAGIWKSQIQNQKNVISSQQSMIDKINDSVRYAPANCVSGCVQWNEQQQRKQEEVERMRGQLEEQKKNLENMQEAARKQGFGSSVYDP
jgi:hypothetical protein